MRLAFGFFQHSQGDDYDLWKLTEFNSDSRFELDAQIHLKQHGQGDDCDLWKLTEFSLDSRFLHRVVWEEMSESM
ncbi:hypothetical protein Taro_011503 [Colocasia esculenta]|uniref:Uncharacterized protein n=1 Tax=Colocasia esculenta TaxID=4460 RepID=A0A843UGB4_COLES|nr:hypothetical protein [Colocasia esculenta]